MKERENGGTGRSSRLDPVILIAMPRPFLRPCLISKKFQDFPSYRILRHMYGALNINENQN